jgi:hypothetical protein
MPATAPVRVHDPETGLPAIVDLVDPPTCVHYLSPVGGDLRGAYLLPVYVEIEGQSILLLLRGGWRAGGEGENEAGSKE